MRLFGLCLVAVLGGSLLSAPNAVAQPQLQIVEPWQTVLLEHNDRKARLTRLAHLRGIEPPEFYEEFVSPAEHGLADYPTDIPVLRVVFRDDVLFDFNRAEVKPGALQVLELIAASLRLEPPDVTLFIAGHTDAIGSVDYNLNLGMRRARAIAEALALIGVNRAQLFAVSFGKAVPIAPNDTEEGRAQNRRVEFLFSARVEAVSAALAKQPAMPCSDKHYTFAQECPSHPVVVAVSVARIGSPRTTSVVARDPTHDVPLHDPVQEVPLGDPTHVIAPHDPATSIRIGERVVEIDLTQKVFHIRAPE